MSDSSGPTPFNGPLPELNTAETLMHSGLQPAMAARIFEAWQTANAECGVELESLIEFTKEYIRDLPYNTGGLEEDATKDDWNKALRNLGANEELRAAIMSEEFKELRMTETAKFWVVDSMMIRYDDLKWRKGVW